MSVNYVNIQCADCGWDEVLIPVDDGGTGSRLCPICDELQKVKAEVQREPAPE